MLKIPILPTFNLFRTGPSPEPSQPLESTGNPYPAPDKGRPLPVECRGISIQERLRRELSTLISFLMVEYRGADRAKIELTLRAVEPMMGKAALEMPEHEVIRVLTEARSAIDRVLQDDEPDARGTLADNEPIADNGVGGGPALYSRPDADGQDGTGETARETVLSGSAPDDNI
jgi:hypothetical protein